MQSNLSLWKDIKSSDNSLHNRLEKFQLQSSHFLVAHLIPSIVGKRNGSRSISRKVDFHEVVSHLIPYQCCFLLQQMQVFNSQPICCGTTTPVAEIVHIGWLTFWTSSSQLLYALFCEHILAEPSSLSLNLFNSWSFMSYKGVLLCIGFLPLFRFCIGFSPT